MSTKSFFELQVFDERLNVCFFSFHDGKLITNRIKFQLVAAFFDGKQRE